MQNCPGRALGVPGGQGLRPPGRGVVDRIISSAGPVSPIPVALGPDPE